MDGEQVDGTIDDAIIGNQDGGHDDAARNLPAATDEGQTCGAIPIAAMVRDVESVRCWCGAALPAARLTGRRRRYCTEDCKGRREAAVKRLRRLEDALLAWRAQKPSAAYPADHIEVELWQLRSDLLAVLQVLIPGPIPDRAGNRNEGCDRDGIPPIMEETGLPVPSRLEPRDDGHEHGDAAGHGQGAS